MKLQLGTLHLDGRPAALTDLPALLGEFAGRPAETAGEIVDGSLLMAYRGDRITVEEDFEVQPLQDGPYVLTWDGRLDNREDFGICFPVTNLQTVSDPAVVLRAFQMFGESVFEKLIGEFALTLWCQRSRCLRFVRSSCGARPLYYVLDDNRLLWCSNFAHLVRVSRVGLSVNDEYVLQYLVTTPNIRDTPLAKVKAIPPNRLVRFEDGQMKGGSELWNPTRLSPLRYRTDGEYEEHCREKVTEAVRVRLHAKNPVFAEMSGGLDSSTVALTADRILRGRNESPHNLQTVSCVYDESKSADERSFIRAVAEHRGIETHLIHEKEQRITLGLADPPFTGLPTTLHCFPGRYEAFSAVMQRYNARVLLTGRGGDHLFWSAAQGAPLVADDVLRMKLIGAHRECRTWSHAANLPYYTFLTGSVLPAAIGSLFPEKYRGEPSELPAWVQPKHRATIAGLPTDFEEYTSWRAAPSKRAQAFVVGLMFRVLGSGFGEEYPQICISHPYSHRPLIEFCLSAPLSQHLRDGATRSLMRRAMRDLLPTKTAKRVSKGLVDECVARALAREQVNLSNVGNWEVCRRGYVVHFHLAEALRLARMGMVHLFGPMIRLFSLERWLRSLDRVEASKTSDTALRNFVARLQVSA